MELNKIQLLIKESFCGLTKFKFRNELLEVITPFSTLNNKFISIFIKIEQNDIIITDGGWIDYNLYEYIPFDESEEIINRIISQYIEHYNVKTTTDNFGKIYYYKKTKNINQVTLFIHELANFATGIINAYCLHFKDPKEEIHRETFREDANLYLKVNYEDKVKFKTGLDDYKNIKYNALISKSNDLYLITYVTGSSPYYFENDLRKSIVNFEIAEKSKYKNFIKEKISIINDECEGYNPARSASIINLLQEKTTKDPIVWTNRKKILELISN